MTARRLIQSLFALFSFAGVSQTYHFANYGVRDGLAQSNVSGIVQDSSGFYWLATDGGVSRFDGKNFVNFTTEDGLADNNVSALFLDNRGILWLGHENGMLSSYDGKAFRQLRSTLLPKDKKIYSFFQERGGALWVLTATGGAVRFADPTSANPDKVAGSRIYSGHDGLSQYVFSGAQDGKGNLWFLTDIGVKVLSKATGKFDFFRPPEMPAGQVSCLARDRKGNFLFGNTAGMVMRYDVVNGSLQTVISGTNAGGVEYAGTNLIYSILEDRNGAIWASSSALGVYRLSRSGNLTLFNTSSGLSVNKVKCIFEDREGNVLLGTAGEGLEVFSGETFISYSKRNGLLDNQVWAVAQDRKGRMWFGTNEGLTVMDPSAPVEKRYTNITVEQGLPSNSVRSIVADRSGDLWIGMWGGRVVRYDAGAGAVRVVPALQDIVNPLVSCMMVDRRNCLWIGTLEGVVKYDIVSGQTRTFRTLDGLSDNDISCIFEDSRGHIWIGTRQRGVTVYNGRTFRKFSRQSGLHYNSISSFGEDREGNIWIGTEGGGAFVFNGRTFANYKSRNGLVSDFVTLITVDSANNVWLGTNKGLNRYNAADRTFHAYRESEGFTGLETKPRATVVDARGNIWFGTVNGAFRYSPRLDLPQILPPVAKLLHVVVNQREQPVGDKLKLSYKENSLLFDYIGISLSNPRGVRYRVMLEGYDESARPLSTQTSEQYSNLSPGNYSFRLEACNASGICSQPISVEIFIQPPYWKTWWFYLLVLSVVTGGLFAYIKIRERKLRLEKKVLEDKVSERTAEVVEKNKELDEINKDITASIRYAKRIQDAILPPDHYVKRHLPQTFILFKPKDIVSGDFYWMEEKDDTVIVAAVDCTGHGVPGAFMSIVGHNLLDRVVGEQNITQPARILDELNKSLTYTLRQADLQDNTVRDGMDIALCAFHKKSGMLEFAGAYNPLWLLRNGEIIEIKANKFPIGNSKFGGERTFTNHQIPLQKGDTIYIFSDGYSDQFGGPNGKKFKASALRQMLLGSQHLSMGEQRELLDRTIEEWRGNHEQVDDILVIGIRFN